MNTPEGPARVELVRDGEIRFALHRLPWQSAEDILEPADELVRHLERSLGQPIPTASIEGPETNPVALILHRDIRAPLGPEEFEVEAAPGRLVLRARTVQATFHAVYWFLETALGVRWLWPGEGGTVVPECRDLSFPLGRRRERPDYAWRAIQVGGACYRAMDLNTTLHGVLGLPLSYLKEFQTWRRRNRFGGLKIADGHRWAEIAPPETYGEAHPEYYALVNGQRDAGPHDGKHGNQPCLAHPDVARLMADYACAGFEAQPDLDAISVALNDGGSACECPDCRAIDEAAGASDVRTIEHFDRVTAEAPEPEAGPRSITDRLFYFLHQVVRQVKPRFPNRLLLTHLYSYYRRPPRTHHLPPEVIGQYCVMGAAFWDETARDLEYARIRETGRRVTHLGIYEYYSNGAWPEVHRLFPPLVAQTVREYHEAGARYFATQPSTGFAANGLNLFVLGRCLWDVRTDPKTVVKDFCQSGFGPAAEQVLSFLGAFAHRWQDTKSGQEATSGVDRHAGFARLYPEAFLKEREAELDAAEKAAASRPDILARLRFLRAGFQHTRLYCDACRTTAAVPEAASAPDLKSIDPDRLPAEPQISRLARAAVRAWDEYWGFVRAHMGQYVFGEFWVHYRPGIYGAKDPVLKKLRDLADIPDKP